MMSEFLDAESKLLREMQQHARAFCGSTPAVAERLQVAAALLDSAAAMLVLGEIEDMERQNREVLIDTERRMRRMLRFC
jgi:hypothetical protein